MYNKTIIEFGFYDIQNNQGLGKCNQPRPPASADYTCLDLDYPGYHKNLIQLLFIIIQGTTKSDARAAGVRLVYNEYDYRLN